MHTFISSFNHLLGFSESMKIISINLILKCGCLYNYGHLWAHWFIFYLDPLTMSSFFFFFIIKFTSQIILLIHFFIFAKANFKDNILCSINTVK